MVIRNIGPRTETEVWEIGAETGVEYPKKLGLDIADGVVLIYQIIHRLHKHRIYLDRSGPSLDRSGPLDLLASKLPL